MIEKIKQNPIKVLGIAAGVFFLAAILFMLLPGITYASESLSMKASLFAIAFAGKSYFTSGSSVTSFEMRADGMIIVPIFLFGIALILAVILICGLIKGNFSKKKKIILTVFTGVLIVAASGIILASKSSMIKFACTHKQMSESVASEFIKGLEASGKFSLGAGAILTPIMMLLGVGSIVGAAVLSIKAAK